MHTLANSQSAAMRQRALRFVETVDCPVCGGTGLRPEALAVTFAGRTIAELVALPLTELAERAAADRRARATPSAAYLSPESGETTEVAVMIAARPVRADRGARRPRARLPEPRPDDDRRCRRASCSACASRPSCARGCSASSTCSTSRRPACTPRTPSRCMTVLDQLKAAGNSLFVVEHDMDVVRRADWVVDVGPGAGERGGHVLYSGPVDGLEDVEESVTARYLFGPGIALGPRRGASRRLAVPAPRHAAQPRTTSTPSSRSASSRR